MRFVSFVCIELYLSVGVCHKVEMRSAGVDLKEDEFLADGLVHTATSLPSGSEVSSVMSDSSE